MDVLGKWLCRSQRSFSDEPVAGGVAVFRCRTQSRERWPRLLTGINKSCQPCQDPASYSHPSPPPPHPPSLSCWIFISSFLFLFLLRLLLSGLVSGLYPPPQRAAVDFTPPGRHFFHWLKPAAIFHLISEKRNIVQSWSTCRCLAVAAHSPN